MRNERQATVRGFGYIGAGLAEWPHGPSYGFPLSAPASILSPLMWAIAGGVGSPSRLSLDGGRCMVGSSRACVFLGRGYSAPVGGGCFVTAGEIKEVNEWQATEKSLNCRACV